VAFSFGNTFIRSLGYETMSSATHFFKDGNVQCSITYQTRIGKPWDVSCMNFFGEINFLAILKNLLTKIDWLID
jgi:hypothetical protein